ncbi:hypothetical protein [Pseudoalteromonas phage J2-1_QLiu-2017]|nr:hypothetical protein [Pseudoalteromonas phage J2-1_QLiu-2017]
MSLEINMGLQKANEGVAFSLGKATGELSELRANIRWIGDDLDIYAVLLGENETPIVEGKRMPNGETVIRDLICYKNQTELGIELSEDITDSADEDGGEAEEDIQIKLNDLRPEIKGIDLILGSHTDNGKAYPFGEVGRAIVELENTKAGSGILYSEVNEPELADQTAVLFAKLRVDNAGNWTYTAEQEALGNNPMGLANVIIKYFPDVAKQLGLM